MLASFSIIKSFYGAVDISLNNALLFKFIPIHKNVEYNKAYRNDAEALMDDAKNDKRNEHKRKAKVEYRSRCNNALYGR